VADSPYPIKVLPGCLSSAHTTTAGPGLKAAAPGAAATFRVQGRDAFGNACEVLPAAALASALPLRAALLAGAGGSVAAEVACVPQDGGYWECSYVAPHAGLFVLEVQVGLLPGGGGGEGSARWRHVHGGPFGVRVAATPAGAEAGGSARVSATAARPRDMVAWWGEVARAEYGDADGDMAGFDEQEEGRKADKASVTPEAAFVEVRG
jgi:hypothetical protein